MTNDEKITQEAAGSHQLNPITLQELLHKRPLPQASRVKLVRHRDTRQDLYTLYRNRRAEFLDYQRQQGKRAGGGGVFDNCDYIVSFLGEEGSRARFIGVFKVEGTNAERETAEHYYYNLTEVAGFEALKERVIIDWGNAAINWHQWLKPDSPKQVLEIQNRPFSRPFTGFLDFTLTFAELQELVNNQGPRDEWRRMLSAVSGVYLILDTATSSQYVGSAYGKEGGIWSRWKKYVDTQGQGGNVKLIELLAPDIQRSQQLQFSVLLTLPKSTPPNEVIAQEHLLMKKLGSRAHGFNS